MIKVNNFALIRSHVITDNSTKGNAQKAANARQNQENSSEGVVCSNKSCKNIRNSKPVCIHARKALRNTPDPT